MNQDRTMTQQTLTKSVSRNEYQQSVARVHKIVALVESFPGWTFRALRNHIMEIHRANGAIFNPATVQTVLGIDAPKRWSDCNKAQVLQLLEHWYRIKQWQTAVSYWETGNYYHTPKQSNRPIASQRCQLGERFVLWTTRVGFGKQSEAQRFINQVAPFCKVACFLKRDQRLVKPNGKTETVRFETDRLYEVKVWGIKLEFLESYLLSLQ